MRTIFLTSYLLITILCNAQINFVKHAALKLDARRAYNEANYEKALKLYDNAFALHNDNSVIEYLKAANSAAELNDEESCIKWLKASITKKKAEQTTIRNISKKAVYQKCATAILKNYDLYLSKFYKNLENPMIYFQIQNLINRDQNMRSLGEYFFGISDEEKEIAFDKYKTARLNKDKAAQKKYWSIIYPKLKPEHAGFQRRVAIYADSLNVVKLIDITKKHGWQKEAFLILWHQRGNYGQDNWVWNYFKPLIIDEIKKGKIEPFYLAIFEDYKSLEINGKTIYGYYPGIVDSKTVNIKRKNIGLPNLSKAEIEARNNRTDRGSIF